MSLTMAMPTARMAAPPKKVLFFSRLPKGLHSLSLGI